VGKSAVPLAMTLRLPYIPVTRVENYCATGTEALRGAVYAVASGAADIALALGVEKLKDTGYGGLPQRGRGALNDLFWPNLSAPGSFAQLATAYTSKHGADKGDLKRAMAHISVKSHANAGKNPKAHLRNAITMDDVMNASMIAEPLGLYDCCGVSDGSACAIVTTPDIAHKQFFSVTMPRDQVEKYWAKMQDESVRILLDAGFVNRPHPQKINPTPMLVLAAENDRVFTLDEQRKTASAYGTQAEIFPNMAHDMMLEADWQAVADRIIAWLDLQTL
jgi:acetyl-CoA acetyltransferase